MNYRHPREIENFDKLATDREPTVRRTSSEITLREDGDGSRDWTLERRWGFGLTHLAFTFIDRPSPSAMAKQLNLRLFFVGAGEHGGWWLENVDRFIKWTISKDEVDRLVPAEFAAWMAKQEEPPTYDYRAA